MEAKVIPPLIAAIHSSDAEVQIQAAAALGKICKNLPAACVAVDASEILSLTRLVSPDNPSIIDSTSETLNELLTTNSSGGVTLAVSSDSASPAAVEPSHSIEHGLLQWIYALWFSVDTH
jgi:hypothetical protein